MAADIELFALATRTTTTYTETRGNVSLQPREVEADVVGSAVDLADNRALNLALAWDNLGSDGANGIADVEVETSHDGVSWRDLAKFSARPVGDSTGSERISCVADRYVRGRARIAFRSGNQAPGKVRFSVSGRAVGSAT